MALTKVTGQVINSTTDLSVGVATVGGGTSTGDLYVVGVSTLVGDLSLNGNVTIGGTLTYEDVTNVDSVGLITARKGITVTANGLNVNAGISTFNADVKVGSGITLSPDGDGFFTGIVTATTIGAGTSMAAAGLTGALPSISGANLTDITQTTINNNANNRLITGSGTANTLEGEATLTYNGTDTFELQPASATPAIFIGDSNRTGAGQGLAQFRGNWNGTTVARITFDAGDDTTNKDDGIIRFDTAPAGSLAEAMRIDTSGRLLLGTTTEGNANADDLTVATSGTTGITIRSGTTSTGNIYFSDGTSGADEFKGAVEYGHSTDSLRLHTGGSERFRIDSNGNTNIVGVCTAASFSPTSGQISNRNLIVNGAMNIAQRGTSSGSSGWKAMDRWRMNASGASAALTQSQTALTSGAPFDLGFRNVFKILNAGQNANTSGYCYIMHAVEAQDLAQSGWDCTSTSSYITLSFWIKASVAQTYLLTLHMPDSSTLQEWNHLITCAANTWKKVTINLPGKSTIAVNNDTGKGMEFVLAAYLGNYYTAGSTVDQWVNHAGYTSRPDMGADWWTTSDSTIEITGVQLEVGQHATPFEHRKYEDDLRMCQRYFWKIDDGNYRRINGYKRHDSNCHFEIQSPVPMRIAPSPTLSDGGLFTNFQSTFTATQSSPTIGEWNVATGQGLLQVSSTWSSTHANIPSWESYAIEFSAEQ